MDFPASIARALAIPANDETGSIHDVKHVVVMMQDRSRLPQVSRIVAPEAYTEHGNWPSNFGAWYVSQMLDALTANPEVWSKTVFFYMFDENDGFFDHTVPPTPPQLRAQGSSTAGTTNELFTGSATYPASVFTPGPYGHGVRVPMIIISPWSKGGG
jgi:phospholipase C